MANIGDSSGQLKWVDLLQEGPPIVINSGDEKLTQDLKDVTFKFVEQNIQKVGNGSVVVIRMNTYPCGSGDKKDWIIAVQNASVPMSIEGCHALVHLDTNLLNHVSPFKISF